MPEQRHSFVSTASSPGCEIGNLERISSKSWPIPRNEICKNTIKTAAYLSILHMLVSPLLVQIRATHSAVAARLSKGLATVIKETMFKNTTTKT
jgi:hypothetical protein